MILILESEAFGDNIPFEDIYGLQLIGYNVSTPEPRTNYVEVPGRNGVLDLTSSLGVITYNNRRVKFRCREFARTADHIARYSEIMNRFHGQKVKVVLDAEPEYYYTGRCIVSDEYTDEMRRMIVIEVDADPMKYPVYATDENWLWDPFRFDNGVIRKYANMPVNGDTTFEIIAYEHPESPKIYVTLDSGQSSMKLNVDGDVSTTFYLHNGLNSFPQIVIQSEDVHEDVHTFRFQGRGQVTIDMKGGVL